MARKEDPFQKTRAAEGQYARELRRIAREIGRIVNSFGSIDPASYPPLRSALEKYSEILRPWAERKAALIVGLVDGSNRREWAKVTQEAGFALRNEIQKTAVGKQFRSLVQGQVELITSMPRKAAERVHRLVIQNVEEAGRAEEIAKEIARTGEVTEGRASTIARTEVSRAASVLTQVRAESIGSEGYIWRTVHDANVRPSHKKMEGKYVRWDSPPTLDGMTGHAGTLPNCRCFSEPVIPKDLL